jgi:large subunit ribosomal protein L2
MRSASLLKLYNDEVATNNYSYIIAPKGTNTFHMLNKFKSDSSLQNKLLKPGDAAPISFFEVGDFIHSLEAFVGQGSIFGRASGSYCQIISVNQSISTYLKNKEKVNFATVRLPSGNKRLINRNAQATLGIVYQKNEMKRNILKAGRIR